MKFVIIGVVILVIAVLFFILANNGLFYKVKVEKKAIESMTIVYVAHQGNYKTTKEPMDALYNKLLNDEKIQTYKGFGIYFDNPSEVEEAKLRSVVGCVLETKDVGQKQVLLGKGYKVFTLPAFEGVYSEYPFKSPMSIMFGIFKVYPAIQKYVKANNIKGNPMMEIYDMPNSKIQYIMNISMDEKILLDLLKTN